jgi:hypothetical protein
MANFALRPRDAKSKWTSHQFDASNTDLTEISEPPGALPEAKFVPRDLQDLPLLDPGTFLGNTFVEPL